MDLPENTSVNHFFWSILKRPNYHGIAIVRPNPMMFMMLIPISAVGRTSSHRDWSQIYLSWSQNLMGKPWENGGLMGFNGI